MKANFWWNWFMQSYARIDLIMPQGRQLFHGSSFEHLYPYALTSTSPFYFFTALVLEVSDSLTPFSTLDKSIMLVRVCTFSRCHWWQWEKIRNLFIFQMGRKTEDEEKADLYSYDNVCSSNNISRWLASTLHNITAGI